LSINFPLPVFTILHALRVTTSYGYNGLFRFTESYFIAIISDYFFIYVGSN